MAPDAYSNVSNALDALDPSMLTDVERSDLVLKLRETLWRTETPWQRLQCLVFEDTAHAAALKISNDIGLFVQWAKGDAQQKTLEELHKLLQMPCEIALLDRVVRALCVKGTLNSPSSACYTMTPFARSLAGPTMAACLDYWFDIQNPAIMALPEFLKSTDYKNPADPTHCAWNHASKSPEPFFAWLQQRPDKMANFAMVMQCYSTSQLPWVDLYPTEDIMKDAREGPLVVDVGGSAGHDLIKFITKHKPPPGSCVLQDQPDVLERATQDAAIVAKPIDFFNEAPVKDAKIYYIHGVLHDWTDDQCKDILSRIKTSMAPHSKILIHELVRLEDGSRDIVSLGDFTVMAVLAAEERTQKKWEAVVQSAGLKISKVYSNPLSTHAILEVTA